MPTGTDGHSDTLSKKKRKGNLSHSLAGFLAGCAGVVVGHPFDTIKVRQQTLDRGSYGSLLQCAKRTVVNEGVLGFYKGLLFPLASEGTRNSVAFGVYGHLVSGDEATMGHVFFSGGLGGAAQAVIACPVELVKIQLQNQTERNRSSRHFHGPVDCTRTLLRQHGMSVLYRGFYTTVSRDIVGWSVYMSSYEWICRRFNRKGPQHCSVLEQLLAGGSAGALSWMVNLPIDAVKSRQQSGPLDSPKTMRQCVSELMSEGGLRSMYRGMTAVIIRAFLSNAVVLTLYTSLRHDLQRLLHPAETGSN